MEDYKSENDDLAAMESMGKEQVFERRITLMGAIGLCVCMSATVSGLSAGVKPRLTTGSTRAYLHPCSLPCCPPGLPVSSGVFSFAQSDFYLWQLRWLRLRGM